jgi:hypothetical protein
MNMEELIIKIKAASELGGFDSLEGKVKKAATDMKAMENTTNAAAKKMKTDLDQVNNSNFSSLNNKFTSTIRSMVSTSASGAKAIGQNLSNMTDGIDGAITSVAAGMGVMDLFEKSMGKALTQTQLKNAKPGDYDKIMDHYMKFTTASSASDDDINKMLRYTYSGNSDSTYKALNAIDAISYSADKLQRQEGIRGWGTYISGGWTAASGMMRDEPLTGDQVKKLQAADTYEERIKAMEEIAKQKGNVDKFGNSLSTTVDGPLGKYNTALAAEDAVIRGSTASFEMLMTWISPLIFGFMSLDPAVQSVIGTALTAGIVVTAVAAGLGILVKVLSPVGSVLSTGVSKLKDALSGAKDVKDKVSGLKDALDSKKLVSTVNIKAANVNVNGKTTGTPNPNKTTPPTTTSSTGSRSGVLSTVLSVIQSIGVGLGVGDILGEYVVKPSLGFLTGQPVSKSYGGVLNVIDSLFGTNTATPVSQKDYETQVREYNKGKANVSDYNKDWNSSLAWLGGATGNTFSAIGSFGSWVADPIKAITGISGNTPLNIPNLPQLLGLNPVSAASPNGSKSSFQDDLKDLFDFSRFNITWPNVDAQGWANNNLVKPVTDGWNGAKNWVTQNPVIGGAITQVENLLKDPQKAWDDAKSYVSRSIVGKAWADAYALYSNVKSWWDAARRYVQTRPIDQSTGLNNGGGGVLAGDEGADAGYGVGPYYEPIITTSSNSTTKKETNYNVTVKVDTVDSDSRVDQIGQAVAIALNNHNNANGN